MEHTIFSADFQNCVFEWKVNIWKAKIIYLPAAVVEKQNERHKHITFDFSSELFNDKKC